MDRHRIGWTRGLEVTLIAAALLVTAYYAHSANKISQESLALSRQLAAAEAARAESDNERAAARDFVAKYFASSCTDKLTQMDLPLRRFYNEMDEAELGEQAMGERCASGDAGAPRTFVVRSVDHAGSSGDGEYLVAATLVYDTGGDDHSHVMDGMTAVEMILVEASEEPVRTAEDLRLDSIAEVLCRSGEPCATG